MLMKLTPYNCFKHVSLLFSFKNDEYCPVDVHSWFLAYGGQEIPVQQNLGFEDPPPSYDSLAIKLSLGFVSRHQSYKKNSVFNSFTLNTCRL